MEPNTHLALRSAVLWAVQSVQTVDEWISHHYVFCQDRQCRDNLYHIYLQTIQRLKTLKTRGHSFSLSQKWLQNCINCLYEVLRDFIMCVGWNRWTGVWRECLSPAALCSMLKYFLTTGCFCLSGACLKQFYLRHRGEEMLRHSFHFYSRFGLIRCLLLVSVFFVCEFSLTF